MTNSSAPDRQYDVLFVGEQTSLVMRLIAELVKRGHRPAVLNGPKLVEKLNSECDTAVDHFECSAVRLPGRHRLSLMRRLEWAMTRSRLQELLGRIEPAVIHLNYVRAEHAMFAEMGRACPPVVATVWGTDLHRDLPNGDRRQQKRMARVLQHAAIVTADSPELLDGVRELAPSKPDSSLKLILWGIDVQAFSSPQAQRAGSDWRRRLGIPPDSPVVLAPRRIDPRYSPQRVLQAFAHSRAARRAYLVFKIFGDNPRTESAQQNMLISLATELQIEHRVRFAPPCPYDDLPGLYQMASVSCFLLSHDGTPTTAFELMAASVPVVASDIEDYHGMFVDGHHAWLVPPEDAPAVAAVLDRILDCPEEIKPQLRFARQWVQQHATTEIMVRSFLAAYQEAGMSRTREAAAS